MMKILTLMLLLVGAVAVPALVADEMVTTDIRLEKLEPADALTMLRSMTGIRQISLAGEKTVRVTATAGDLELARLVVRLAEHPSALSEDTPTHEFADGAVLACVVLKRTDPLEALMALRKEIGLRRVATNTPLSAIMVQDTPEKVASALALMRRMELTQE